MVNFSYDSANKQEHFKKPLQEENAKRHMSANTRDKTVIQILM